MGKKKGRKGDKQQAETLIEAVAADDLDRLRELIAEGADVDEVGDEETALAKAAELGSVPVVQELLKAGADANFGGFSVPLCNAAYAGHAKVVRLLLDAGAEADRAEEEGITALMSAAKAGHLDIAKMLIKAGADPKLTDSDGESALLKGRAHPEILKLLKPLSSPEDVEYLEQQGKTPDPRVQRLVKAAEDGKLAEVRKLLAAGVPVDGTAETQRTALHVAAEAGHLEIAEALLAAGATVDCKDQYGRTPLWEAADAGHLPVAERLLAAGADINARERIESKTPFLAAIGRREPSRRMMEFLAARGADLAAVDEYGRSALALADRDLHADDADAAALRELIVKLGIIAADAGQLTAAAGNGDLDTVRRLIEAGMSPDTVDDQERTPLFMAVSRRRSEVVAYLLKAKADPSKPVDRDDKADTQWGGVPAPCPKCGHIFVAIVHPRQCPQCSETFDTRNTLTGGQPDLPLYITFHNNFTPLMAAAKLGDANIARMLIEAKAKINRGNDQITPLMCACHLGHVEVTKLLIEKGADVKKVAKAPGCSDKVTAIQIAGKAGHIDIVKLLWGAGVPATQKEQTLLVDACERGDVKAIRSLLAEGADPNQPDPLTGHWPLQAAATEGHPDAVEVLINAGAVATQPASKQFPALITIAEKFQRRCVTGPDEQRYLATVQKLLDAGARATVSVFGITPLSMAEDSNHQPLIDMLRAAAEREKKAKKSKR